VHIDGVQPVGEERSYGILLGAAGAAVAAKRHIRSLAQTTEKWRREKCRLESQEKEKSVLTKTVKSKHYIVKVRININALVAV
jgi:hypothetical protein